MKKIYIILLTGILNLGYYSCTPPDETDDLINNVDIQGCCDEDEPILPPPPPDGGD
ncbi:hypothetical protein LS482_10750 [Sinomicrobium kalidii]|uniref:hypothetical protein n=1 Tax=Sinomicrobium kalidii TaxID=2900738 RepID=UPI001E64E453|nr:hypothetical protein [Sinomicrobium kalidii]UGU14191.1 hypothetical protein LS482_10750 [Sinomicrobium kalidii]